MLKEEKKIVNKDGGNYRECFFNEKFILTFDMLSICTYLYLYLVVFFKLVNLIKVYVIFITDFL